MQHRNLTDVGIPLGGIVPLAVGTYFPLFRVNPSRPADAPVSLGYVLEQSTGIQEIDFALVIPAGIVAMMLITERFRLYRAVLSVLTGLLAVGTATHYLFVSSFGFEVTVAFVPALGWYGLVVGGVLLALAGGRYLMKRIRRLTTPIALTG